MLLLAPGSNAFIVNEPESTQYSSFLRALPRAPVKHGVATNKQLG